MSEKKSDSVPAKMQSAFDEITALTDAVCHEHLDEEYAQLAAALARKRPSPLEKGKRDVWAAAIVYSLGTVNFLFDKTHVPYLRADDLSHLFGVIQKTAANKARVIRDTLKVSKPIRNGGVPRIWRRILSSGGSR
jgi:hypothetical protein